MSLTKITALNELILLVKSIPFVSSRYTLRLSDYFLSLTDEQLKLFCNNLLLIKESLQKCPLCFCWKDVDIACVWCENKKNDIVCVVETWIDVLSIQRSGIFDDAYHVLGGVISPLDGVMPDMLTINQLVNRIVENSIKEVILALNQTPEGESTAYFIDNIIRKKNINVKVTYIVSGVPVGSSLEFVDKLTLAKAINNRRG